MGHRPTYRIIDLKDVGIYCNVEASPLVVHFATLVFGICSSNSSLPTFFLGNVAVKPWELFSQFGKIACVHKGKNFLLPSAEKMIAFIASERQKFLRYFRGVIANPGAAVERYRAAFQKVKSGRELERRVVANASRISESGVIAERAATVWLLDLLELYVRQKANYWPAEKLGVALGRRCEMAYLEQMFPERTKWTSSIRSVLEEHFLPVLEDIQNSDFGEFALPDHGEKRKRTRSKSGEDRTETIRYVPERMKFYLGLESYVEVRALQGQHRNDYVLFAFTAEENNPHGRYVLDTVVYGNRLFGLEGKLADVLATVQLTKRQIGESPLCRTRLVHDHQGRWQESIRSFLG